MLENINYHFIESLNHADIKTLSLYMADEHNG